ncbi:unnamed protein product [Amoebophrya sp. A120]|nr:unnamed protein product [Amoebophrya sp. A120]|eukprot:GSA120T00003184001.1
MAADAPAKDAKVSLKKNVSQESYGGPARAKSAYMLFCDVHRPEVIKKGKAESAEFKLVDSAKKLGELWKAASAEDKAKFEAGAAEQKKSYDAKMEEWLKTKEYKEFQKADGAHKKKKKGAAAKKEAQEGGMPKAPASSYMQFSGSIIREVMEEMTKNGQAANDMKARAGIIKTRWDALGAAEKEALEKKYVAQKEQYAKDLAAWNETEAGKKYAAAQLELDPKKALKASGQPTKPGSPYMLYSAEVTAAVIEELKGQGKPADLKTRSAIIKSRFDALSAEDKQKYEAKHKELSAKYEADMKEFKKTPEYKKFNALIQKDKKKRASSGKPKAEKGTKKRKVEGGEPQPEESPADEDAEEVSEEAEAEVDDEEESPEEEEEAAEE